MTELILQALYIFFVVLEMLLFLYIICSWFSFAKKFKETLAIFLDPLFDPIRYLLKHSIMKSNISDISPIISLIVIAFFQQLFSS